MTKARLQVRAAATKPQSTQMPCPHVVLGRCSPCVFTYCCRGRGIKTMKICHKHISLQGGHRLYLHTACSTAGVDTGHGHKSTEPASRQFHKCESCSPCWFSLQDLTFTSWSLRKELAFYSRRVTCCTWASPAFPALRKVTSGFVVQRAAQ